MYKALVSCNCFENDPLNSAVMFIFCLGFHLFGLGHVGRYLRWNRRAAERRFISFGTILRRLWLRTWSRFRRLRPPWIRRIRARIRTPRILRRIPSVWFLRLNHLKRRMLLPLFNDFQLLRICEFELNKLIHSFMKCRSHLLGKERKFVTEGLRLSVPHSGQIWSILLRQCDNIKGKPMKLPKWMRDVLTFPCRISWWTAQHLSGPL